MTLKRWSMTYQYIWKTSRNVGGCLSTDGTIQHEFITVKCGIQFYSLDRLPDLATYEIHSLQSSKFVANSRNAGLTAYMLLYWKMGINWTIP